jgi:hypothetical protein
LVLIIGKQHHLSNLRIDEANATGESGTFVDDQALCAARG